MNLHGKKLKILYTKELSIPCGFDKSAEECILYWQNATYKQKMSRDQMEIAEAISKLLIKSDRVLYDAIYIHDVPKNEIRDELDLSDSALSNRINAMEKRISILGKLPVLRLGEFEYFFRPLTTKRDMIVWKAWIGVYSYEATSKIVGISPRKVANVIKKFYSLTSLCANPEVSKLVKGLIRSQATLASMDHKKSKSEKIKVRLPTIQETKEELTEEEKQKNELLKSMVCHNKTPRKMSKNSLANLKPKKKSSKKKSVKNGTKKENSKTDNI